MTEPNFTITDYNKYSFLSQREPLLYSSFSSSFSSVFEGKPYHKLYFLPKASQRLLEDEIAWKRKTPNNSREQAGLLLGSLCQDGESDVLFGEVHDIVPLQGVADIAQNKQLFERWPLFIEETANNLKCRNSPVKIIGLYHTYPEAKKLLPGKLDAEMQKSLGQGDEFYFIAIFDPHQTYWKAYWGQKQKECLGILISTPAEETGEYLKKSLVAKRIEPTKTHAKAEQALSADKVPVAEKESVFRIIKKNDLLLNKVTAVFLIEKYGIQQKHHELLEQENAVFLTRNAQNLLWEHIGWGKKTKTNIVEQGGLLIGSPYQVNDNFISVAESIIPGESTSSNAAYLELGNDAWSKMLEEFDSRFAEKEYKIIGWYHTHPNSLGVFMSGTDMATQRRFFNKKWHFAVVLNPHTKKYKAFYSEKGPECRIVPVDGPQ
jgi:proteasome lid subunit RPN8/RPN11